ncbi:MAG: glucosamine-6-phosphate deaminase [Sphingobacteriaceae bacterium]
MISEADQLKIVVSDTREQLGIKAADAVSEKMNELLKNKASINMIFAAAPSQNEFLAALIEKPIDWSRINAFHMDEYVGLSADAPQGFGNFLKERLFGKVPFKSVNYLNGNADSLDEECKRYSLLLKTHPCDIVCMGIGENTHIAFNDPHVADFNDPALVKVVDLDEQCRNQQVNDGCFNEIGEVPTHALTLTVPALNRASHVFCMVPGEKKAQAVQFTLHNEVSEKYPSTILRNHPSAILFIDSSSSSLL